MVKHLNMSLQSSSSRDFWNSEAMFGYEDLDYEPDDDSSETFLEPSGKDFREKLSSDPIRSDDKKSNMLDINERSSIVSFRDNASFRNMYIDPEVDSFRNKVVGYSSMVSHSNLDSSDDEQDLAFSDFEEAGTNFDEENGEEEENKYQLDHKLPCYSDSDNTEFPLSDKGIFTDDSISNDATVESCNSYCRINGNNSQGEYTKAKKSLNFTIQVVGKQRLCLNPPSVGERKLQKPWTTPASRFLEHIVVLRSTDQIIKFTPVTTETPSEISLDSQHTMSSTTEPLFKIPRLIRKACNRSTSTVKSLSISVDEFGLKTVTDAVDNCDILSLIASTTIDENHGDQEHNTFNSETEQFSIQSSKIDAEKDTTMNRVAEWLQSSKPKVPHIFKGLCYTYFFHNNCRSPSCYNSHYFNVPQTRRAQLFNLTESEVDEAYQFIKFYPLCFAKLYELFTEIFSNRNDKLKLIDMVHYVFGHNTLDKVKVLTSVLCSLQKIGPGTIKDALEFVMLEIGLRTYEKFGETILKVILLQDYLPSYWPIIKRLFRNGDTIPVHLGTQFLTKLMTDPVDRHVCMEVYQHILQVKWLDMTKVQPQIRDPFLKLSRFSRSPAQNYSEDSMDQNSLIQRCSFGNEGSCSNCVDKDLNNSVSHSNFPALGLYFLKERSNLREPGSIENPVSRSTSQNYPEAAIEGQFDGRCNVEGGGSLSNNVDRHLSSSNPNVHDNYSVLHPNFLGDGVNMRRSISFEEPVTRPPTFLPQRQFGTYSSNQLDFAALNQQQMSVPSNTSTLNNPGYNPNRDLAHFRSQENLARRGESISSYSSDDSFSHTSCEYNTNGSPGVTYNKDGSQYDPAGDYVFAQKPAFLDLNAEEKTRQSSDRLTMNDKLRSLNEFSSRYNTLHGRNPFHSQPSKRFRHTEEPLHSSSSDQLRHMKTPEQPVFGHINFDPNYDFNVSLHNLYLPKIDNVDINEEDVHTLNNCIREADAKLFLELLAKYCGPLTVQNFISMTLAHLKGMNQGIAKIYKKLLVGIEKQNPFFYGNLKIRVVLEVITMNILFELDRRNQFVDAKDLLMKFTNWDSLVTSRLFITDTRIGVSIVGRYLFIAKLLVFTKPELSHEILVCPNFHLMEEYQKWPYYPPCPIPEIANADLEARNIVLITFLRVGYRLNTVVVNQLYKTALQRRGGIWQFDVKPQIDPMIVDLINRGQTFFLKDIFSEINMYADYMEKDTLKAFLIIMCQHLKTAELFELLEKCIAKNVYRNFVNGFVLEHSVEIKTNMLQVEIELIILYYFYKLVETKHLPERNESLRFYISLPGENSIKNLPMLKHNNSLLEVTQIIKEFLWSRFNVASNNLLSNVVEVEKDELMAYLDNSHPIRS